MTTPRTQHDEARERALRAAGIDPLQVPEHVAVIMDGNGRWAKRRGEKGCLAMHMAWNPCVPRWRLPWKAACVF